jgi:hypothetical protein
LLHNKFARVLKKLKNLPRGRQSMMSLLEEVRAMRISYSQFGEDLVVRMHFMGNFDNSVGRFIDVGAFHPFKYSNTMLLSQLGWRGINIDCNPVKIAGFKKLRPQTTISALRWARARVTWFTWNILAKGSRTE